MGRGGPSRESGAALTPSPRRSRERCPRPRWGREGSRGPGAAGETAAGLGERRPPGRELLRPPRGAGGGLRSDEAA